MTPSTRSREQFTPASLPTLVSVAGLVLMLAACTAGGPLPAAARSNAVPSEESPAARVMIAEIALERGDCVQASENYVAVITQSDDARLAARAAAVSMVCGLLIPAEQAVKHWRRLAPNDADAALAATLLALKLYRLDDARGALRVWRDSGAQGAQDPGEFADLLERESDATAAFTVFSDVLASEDPTAEVLLAQGRLALRAFNVDQAIRCGNSVLALDSDNAAAAALVVRAQAVRGDAAAALSGARKLQPRAQGEDRYIVADVLAALDRGEEAREELLRLSEVPELRAGTQHRLGSLALDRGEEAVAERHFSQLVTQQGNSTLAVLYLARIAERRGDRQGALQRYAMLADSPLAMLARTRAAALLIESGQREQALALIDEYARSNPEEAVELAVTRASLLLQGGDPAAASADIETALRRFPGHPTLEFQRAAILERSGRRREAEAAFEKLLRARPHDPGIANALGYTLADHNRELPRASRLIEQALAVSPDSPAIQDSQGWVMFRQGKLKEASAVLARAWRSGHDAEIGAHWGEVLWRLGDRAQAQAVWARALAADPKNKALQATVDRLTADTGTRQAK